MSDKRKFELKEELKKNNKRRKILNQKQIESEQELDKVRKQQEKLKKNRQAMRQEFKYNGLTWLAPVRYQDLTPLEKQYDGWCENICATFEQHWPSLRNEIHRFHHLHFMDGWKQMLNEFLNLNLVRDVIGLVVEYVQNDPWMEISKKYPMNSWEEARQAMFWLWCPRFTRPNYPVLFTQLHKSPYSLSYSIQWRCQNTKCTREHLHEQEDMYIQMNYNDDEVGLFYTTCDFHNGELQHLLDFLWAQDDRTYSWMTFISKAKEYFIQDPILTALFLIYFESRIGWLEKLRNND